MDFSKALNRLGETLIMREDSADYGSDDIGAAFQKFSVVTKELSNLMKTLVSKKRGANGLLTPFSPLLSTFRPFDVLFQETFYVAVQVREHSIAFLEMKNFFFQK